MRDPSEFQEIENLGGDEEWTEAEEKRNGGSQGSGSFLPLFQAALCVLAILALVCLKFTDGETYGKVRDWYQSEISREIELPKWAPGEEESSAPPSPKPSETPITAELENGALQRV